MSVSNYSVYKNLLWRYAERVLAQTVTFIVSLILARMLSPEDYGAVAIITIVVSVFDIFSTRGFSQALIQKRTVDSLDYSTIFITNMGIDFILYIVIFLGSPYIAVFYGNKQLSKLIRVLGINLLINGFNSIQQAYVQRNMLYHKFFFSTLIGTVISAVVGIMLAYKGMGAWALVAQSLVNTCIDTTVLFFTIEWKPKLEYSFKRLCEMSGYGLRMFVMGLLESVYNELRSLVIGKVYSPSQLAFYNKGQHIPSLIVNNVQTSTNNVFFSAMSREERYEDVKRKMHEYFGLMFYIMSPLLMGLAVISRNLISLLYTSKWDGAVPYMIIYCFSYLTWVIQVPILQGINSRGKANISLKLTVMHRIVGSILLFVTVFHGPIAIAVSALISDIIVTLLALYEGKKLFNYKIWDFFEDIKTTLVITIIMAIFVGIIGLLEINIVIKVIFQVLVGGCIYVLFSFILHNSWFEMIKKIVKKRLQRRYDDIH